MNKTRHITVAIAVIGALWTGYSFLALSGTSLPYQDPTPEMAAAQRAQVEFWETSFVVGAAVFAIGLAGVVWSRRGRRRR